MSDFVTIAGFTAEFDKYSQGFHQKLAASMGVSVGGRACGDLSSEFAQVRPLALLPGSAAFCCFLFLATSLWRAALTLPRCRPSAALPQRACTFGDAHPFEGARKAKAAQLAFRQSEAVLAATEAAAPRAAPPRAGSPRGP